LQVKTIITAGEVFCKQKCQQGDVDLCYLRAANSHPMFLFIFIFFVVHHLATFIFVIFPVCITSTQYTVPGFAHDHEPSALTTRPWLQPSNVLIIQIKLKPF
jgi:hypothetical protein